MYMPNELWDSDNMLQVSHHQTNKTAQYSPQKFQFYDNLNIGSKNDTGLVQLLLFKADIGCFHADISLPSYLPDG